MRSLVCHGLRALANGSKHTSAAREWLPGVVGDSVVNNDELAWSPAVSAPILLHVLGEVAQHVVREGCIVSKNDSLLGVVARVNPARIGSDDLIEEGLVSV